MDWSLNIAFHGRGAAVRAVWAVWARAAGVGHGLEPVKHCFSWQGRWRGGGGASAGRGYRSSEGGAMGLH